MSEEAREKLRVAEEHMDNFHRALARGELDKAGEFLWATVNAIVHALALARGERLPAKHGAIRNFVKKLAGELEDKALWDAFRDTEKLHANFFSPGIFEEEELRAMVDNVLNRLIKPLYELAERELGASPHPPDRGTSGGRRLEKG